MRTKFDENRLCITAIAIVAACIPSLLVAIATVQAKAQENVRQSSREEQSRQPLDLGEFELPLEYAPGEEEGRGWLCPSLQPVPSQRAMFIVRQEMIARTEPVSSTMPLELLFPAPRNLGEQRRLASRIRVKFASLDRLDQPEQILEHAADVVYSQPYDNPFVRVRFSAPHGDVTVTVDSWISSSRPPAGKLGDNTNRFRRSRRSSEALSDFLTQYEIAAIPHWAEPEEGQPRGPAIVQASGETPFELAHNVVEQTAKLVPYQAGLHMSDPFQVMTSEGGDAESRATVVWYALQDEMPVCMVSGYYRPFVDTEFAGFDAWNALVLDGYCVADVMDGTSYLGHDHAQYVATGIGADHLLDGYPQLRRHLSYAAGLHFHMNGEITMRQYASLTATSGLAFDLPDGRYTFPKFETAIGRGADAEELDTLLRNPPPGIIALAEEVAKTRREVNERK